MCNYILKGNLRQSKGVVLKNTWSQREKDTMWILPEQKASIIFIIHGIKFTIKSILFLTYLQNIQNINSDQTEC